MALKKGGIMQSENPLSREGSINKGRRANQAQSVFRTAPMLRAHLEQVVSLLQEISAFEPSPAEFDEIWSRFTAQKNSYPLVVLSEEFVVAFGVLLIEHKVRGGKLGHIEDVVSHPDKRGLGAGSLVVRELIELAAGQGCYKVTLHCQEHNVGFYEKQGLTSNGKSLQKLF